MRDVTKVVPSPKGGMLYNVWKDEKMGQPQRRPDSGQAATQRPRGK